MAVKIAGVDMSRWQSNIDYSALAVAKIEGIPVEFAMLRFSYGEGKDTLFDKHYSGCKAAGIKVGCYHWLKAQNLTQARSEANWLAEQLKGYKFDYPVAIDFEDSELFALGLTKARYTAIVDTFARILQNAGYYVILYTNPDTLENRLNKDILDRYDLWLAHWTDVPAQYGQKMWQYAALGTAAQVKNGQATAVGKVDGANGAIDVNWSYVDYASVIGGDDEEAPPAEDVPVGRDKAVAIVGTKILTTSAELTTAQNQLKALGYTVTTANIVTTKTVTANTDI